jgi:hypothetical protein
VLVSSGNISLRRVLLVHPSHPLTPPFQRSAKKLPGVGGGLTIVFIKMCSGKSVPKLVSPTTDS